MTSKLHEKYRTLKLSKRYDRFEYQGPLTVLPSSRTLDNEQFTCVSDTLLLLSISKYTIALYTLV